MKNLKHAFTAIIVLGFSSNTTAQIIVNSLTQTVTQNFNSLSSTGNSNTWENNQTLLGWYGYRNNGTQPVTIYRADDGASNSGGLYSYGENDSDTNRSLGSLASGTTGRMTYGVRLKNTSGTTISQVSVKYTGKQWRVASNITNFLEMSYKINNTISGLTNDEISNNTGFVRVPDGDFSSRKLAATASKLNGNDADNKMDIDVTINVKWIDGDELFLRWDDPDMTGSDHGMSIDDLEIIFSNNDIAAPEVISAEISNTSNLKIFFNEPLNITDAEDISNYSISPISSISNATYNALEYSVTLQSDFLKGYFYSVKIENIRDSALAPNKLDSAIVSDLIFNDFDGAGLYITELMYDNPDADFLEFIELYNSSKDTIELGGLTFSNSLSHVFDQSQIAPETFMVLSRTKDSVDFYLGTQSVEWQSGSLGNFSTNTTITLKNTKNETLIEFTYQNSGTWSELAAGNGHSLEFLVLNRNITLGNSWTPAKEFACIFRGDSVFATPGYANISDTPEDTSNISVKFHELNGVKVYPNPAQKYIYVENINLISNNTNELNFEITDVAGKNINTFTSELEGDKIKLDISTFKSGMYYINIVQNGIKKTIFVVKEE